MVLNWRGRTRLNLASADRTMAVESVLERLSEYVGSKPLVDDETGPRAVLNLRSRGSLRHWVELELDRSEQNAKRLRSLITHDVPHARRFGSVHFVSQDGMKHIHLSFDEFELAPNMGEMRFGNTLSIESTETVTHTRNLDDTALWISSVMFDSDLFDHGLCCLSDEYDKKNLDRSGGGVRAVGLDASKYLPGFYWGNYFGPYLCGLVGREKLLETPGCRSVSLASGVLLVNELSPDLWADPVFINNERLAIDYIGRHLFFEKERQVDGHLFVPTTRRSGT